MQKRQCTAYSSSNAGNVKKYEWIIDGGAPVTGSAKYTVVTGSTGNHTARLVITDVNGCTDSSLVKQFVISGPTALFGLSSNGGCASKLITFSDSSNFTLPISKWIFDFGDGAPQTFNSGPFTHIYGTAGKYTVKLRVVDNAGCSDTFQLPQKVSISKVNAGFSSAYAKYCPNVQLQFTDTSAGNALQYAWSFGDGGTSVNQNPQHIYTGNDSIYTVKAGNTRHSRLRRFGN